MRVVAENHLFISDPRGLAHFSLGGYVHACVHAAWIVTASRLRTVTTVMA